MVKMTDLRIQRSFNVTMFRRRKARRKAESLMMCGCYMGVGGGAAHLLQTPDLKAAARKVGCWKKNIGEAMVPQRSEAP